MPYVSMLSMLKKASREKYAVGAFNIVNELTARAAIQAAEELCSPLILQTSVATVKQFGIRGLIQLLKPMAERAQVPVAIHLDHCTDEKLVMDAIDAGWSSVMFDGSKLSFEENCRITRRVVEYAAGRDVTTEGEVGAIVGVEDDAAVNDDEAALATLPGCLEFIKRTGVDVLAPAIGTAHGLYHFKPNIRYELLKEIAKNAGRPLVVHGGTGLSEQEFQKLTLTGAAKINISTAIKIAYCRGMGDYTGSHAGENNPLKLDAFVANNVKKVVKDHIQIFGSADKIPKEVAR